jgi:hypothetical protein
LGRLPDPVILRRVPQWSIMGGMVVFSHDLNCHDSWNSRRAKELDFGVRIAINCGRY